jgi:hypothetical protein
MPRAEDYDLHDSYIADSGTYDREQPPEPKTWSHGVSIEDCNNGRVERNRFEDNTDIDLVVNSGPCIIRDNQFVHRQKYGQAAINLGNLDAAGSGNAPYSGPQKLDSRVG